MRERMQEMLHCGRVPHKMRSSAAVSGWRYPEDLFRQELELNKRYLDERLRDQEGYYAASDAHSNWAAGTREAHVNPGRYCSGLRPQPLIL
jgi:lambda family phage tail tape measure protein